MRLVAYIRVSREDERPENQEYAVYRWVAERGHQIVETVRDVGVSGALPPAQRPGWRRVLKLLESADGAVVYALDRLARSLWDLAAVVKELEARGKHLLSVREEWLQPIDPKVRQLIISVLGWAAEIERKFIRERTREAIARLKAQGKHVGRSPKWSEQTRRRIIDLVKRGLTLKEACRLVGVSYRTAHATCRETPNT
jgi:DNA invertase Pin-like site-specific DNA recombinase